MSLAESKTRTLRFSNNRKYGENPFTDFSSVNRRTPLGSLNLNWSEQDLPERVRTKHVHRLHPYLGKFIPQLVEIFLRKYRPARVLDPFVGSGTTLVEALALGIESYGFEISEFNCKIARVKTAKYDLQSLKKDQESVLNELLALKDNHLFSKENKLLKPVSPYLLMWYDPRALALHFFHYNFMRIHQSLRVTPAMEAGISRHISTWEELLGVAERRAA